MTDRKKFTLVHSSVQCAGPAQHGSFGPSDKPRRNVPLAFLGALVGLQHGSRQARATSRGNQNGKVVLITGASSGIGKAAALELAQSGCYGTVVLAGRNEAKHEKVIKDLQKLAGDKLRADFRYLSLDLASLQTVRTCVKAFESLGLPLHALVNNGGIMAVPQRQVTEDGFELQFEVDYLSHFLLTALLLPRLEASGTSEDPARVISVSSAAHFVKSPLAFGDTSDLNSGGADDAHNYYPWTAYGQAKLAQVEFTYELCKRLTAKYGSQSPVVAHVLHPGLVDTDISRYLGGKMPPLPGIKSPAGGAETLVFLATSQDPAVVKTSGRYWEDSKIALSLGRGSNPAPWSPEMAVPGTDSYNETYWSRLWKASENLVGMQVQV